MSTHRIINETLDVEPEDVVLIAAIKMGAASIDIHKATGLFLVIEDVHGTAVTFFLPKSIAEGVGRSLVEKAIKLWGSNVQ